MGSNDLVLRDATRTLGFEVVGTFREVGFKHGRWCDVTWFQKALVD